MNKKILSIGISGIISFCCIPTIQTSIVGNAYFDEMNERTAGLISQYHNSISNSNGNISLTAWTHSSNNMSWIGIQNISIERSSDNVHWTEESNLGSMYTFNSSSYTITNYNVIVNGGYYYRVSLKHYADNGYGTTQTVDNTSNTVWIPHP